MPFVVLVVSAFALGMIWDKRPSKRIYLVFLLGAAAATIYFMR
jgi:hypothetical protein